MLGRFIGEMRDRYHLIQVSSTTDSGTEVRKCIVLFMADLGNKGIKNIYMLQDEEETPLTIV